MPTPFKKRFAVLGGKSDVNICKWIANLSFGCIPADDHFQKLEDLLASNIVYQGVIVRGGGGGFRFQYIDQIKQKWSQVKIIAISEDSNLGNLARQYQADFFWLDQPSNMNEFPGLLERV